MDILLFGGIVAGVLQALGYVLYARDRNIDPNPVTWFMFAYGTLLLVVLEWDSNASLAELILPIVCTVMAIWISARCWVRARRVDRTRWWPKDWWPENWQDQISFSLDIALSVSYVLAWILLGANLLTEEQKAVWVILFLVGTNASTFTSFYPLLHGVYKNPNKERPLPWIIWTAAYVLLGFVTYETQGTMWHELMLYPLLNAPLHAAVAWYSRPSRQRAYASA